jgi:hypothetical protein
VLFGFSLVWGKNALSYRDAGASKLSQTQLSSARYVYPMTHDAAIRMHRLKDSRSESVEFPLSSTFIEVSGNHHANEVL